MIATQQRIRVVTLIENLPVTGGAERIACEIAAGLEPDRFESVLCATRQANWEQMDDVLVAAGVRVVRLNRSTRADLTAWLPLLELLRRERVDILHAHLFGSNAWGAVIGTLARIPTVIAHEHGQSYLSPVRSIVYRTVVARGADLILCASRHDRTQMIEQQGIPPDRIRVVPNGIPPLAPAPAGIDVRREVGVDAGAPVVGIVANFRPEKAVPHAVRAFARVLSDVPAAHMLVAGDGPQRDVVYQTARALGIETRVHLLGLRRDISAVLEATDVAVLASQREGSPLALLEYMAAGRAIVATDVGGVRDILRSGVDGVTVDAGDEVALASAVARLLGDADLRSRLGRSAQRRQLREFSFDATLARVVRIYEAFNSAAHQGRPMVAGRGWQPDGHGV